MRVILLPRLEIVKEDGAIAPRGCFRWIGPKNDVDFTEQDMTLDDAIKKLREFVADLKFQPEVSATEAWKVPTTLLNRGESTVLLIGDEAVKYRAVIDELYGAVGRKEFVSKAAVEKLVGTLMVRIFGDGDRRAHTEFDGKFQEYLNDLKRFLLKEPENWEWHIAVEGLAPSGLPLKVGGIEFYVWDDAQSRAIAKRMAQLRPQETASVREAAEAQVLRDASDLLGHAVATVRVKAVDRDAAQVAATKRLRITIDAINFYLARASLGGWLFLPGDTVPLAQVAFAFGGEELGSTVRFLVGPNRKIPLNQIAERPGFARVSEMLSRERPSDLDERVLAALQWAGRAQMEARREEAFLLYAISLESLLLGKEVKTEITHQLGVRCAHLNSGPSLEGKKAVRKQVGKLYDVRSKIVHTGNFQVTDAELDQMREYAVFSLLIVLNAEPFRSMTTVREFDDWFDAQLLAGGLAPPDRGGASM